MEYMNLKVNGHHIFTLQMIAPGFYRVRLGVGGWRYIFGYKKANALCENAQDRLTASCRK